MNSEWQLVEYSHCRYFCLFVFSELCFLFLFTFIFQDKWSFLKIILLIAFLVCCVRLVAPIRTLKLLLLGQQWPTTQIQLTARPHPPMLSFWRFLLNFIFKALYIFISGIVSFDFLCQPPYLHRLFFLQYILMFVGLPGFTFGCSRYCTGAF